MRLTRSHFSYNKMEGARSTCKGIGEVIQIDETVLFDKNLSIEQGAVTPWVGQYLDYQLENIKRTLDYYGVPIEAETALKDFNELQWALLKFGCEGR